MNRHPDTHISILPSIVRMEALLMYVIPPVLQERAAARGVKLFLGYTAGDSTGADSEAEKRESRSSERRLPGPQRLLALLR